MQYRIQKSTNQIDWDAVYNLLLETGLGTHSAALRKKAFENSYSVVFLFDEELLIGVGRAISDGAYDAGIYDVAVLPAYQGKKLGRLIVEELQADLQGINIILFARPGKEPFYRKLGYRRMCTGMARFIKESAMREKGFTD